jgi:hypothetical protein
VDGGKGGDPGKPGDKGTGGTGGPQGDKNDPCPARSEYAGSNGPDGRIMDDIDSGWQNDFRGADGKKGDWAAYELSGLPA